MCLHCAFAALGVEVTELSTNKQHTLSAKNVCLHCAFEALCLEICNKAVEHRDAGFRSVGQARLEREKKVSQINMFQPLSVLGHALCVCVCVSECVCA